MTHTRAGLFLLLGLVLLQPGCLLLDKQPLGNIPREQVTLPPDKTADLSVAVSDQMVARGHYSEAIYQLSMARQVNPGLDVSPRLARLLARAGRDQEAIAEYENALKTHPKDAGLWNDFGYYQYERGNFPEAERALRRAVEADPNHKRGWTNLGLALGQQGKIQESLTAFEQAVKPAEARCNLAFVLGTQGKFDEARRLYREALQLDPGLKVARHALAKIENRPPSIPSSPRVATAPQQSPGIPQKSSRDPFAYPDP
ncbi:MAG: tetratricopeptide repeat protein [Gemmataceae bacterium]